MTCYTQTVSTRNESIFEAMYNTVVPLDSSYCPGFPTAEVVHQMCGLIVAGRSGVHGISSYSGSWQGNLPARHETLEKRVALYALADQSCVDDGSLRKGFTDMDSGDDFGQYGYITVYGYCYLQLLEYPIAFTPATVFPERLFRVPLRSEIYHHISFLSTLAAPSRKTRGVGISFQCLMQPSA